MEELLKRFKQFSSEYLNIPDEDYKLVLPYIKVKNYQKKEQWMLEGNVYYELYFVLDGLSYVYKNLNGSICTSSFLKPNDFFIDFNSILTKSPSDLNAQCIEDTTLLTIPYEVLEHAYQKSHAISNFGRMMFQRAFADYIQLTSSIQKTPKQSYETFIAENPNLVNKIPLKILASFIGVTPESLSRIRKRIVS